MADLSVSKETKYGYETEQIHGFGVLLLQYLYNTNKQVMNDSCKPALQQIESLYQAGHIHTSPPGQG